MTLVGRFARFLQRDDRAKEIYLAEVAQGHQAMALERVNTTTGENITEATLRQWLSDDPDFAKALRAARRGEGSGHAQCIDLNGYVGGSPLDPPPPGTPEHQVEQAGWRRWLG